MNFKVQRMYLTVSDHKINGGQVQWNMPLLTFSSLCYSVYPQIGSQLPMVKNVSLEKLYGGLIDYL